MIILSADFIICFDPEATDWKYIYSAPNISSKHFFGTDSLGRDLFARTLQGSRTTLMIGFVSALISLFIGISVGLISGFYEGNIDKFLMRLVDILYSIPYIFFIILLVTFIEKNIILTFVAIGLINWLDLAKIIRGQTLNIKSKAYICGAIAAGASNFRIIFKYILPNLMSTIIIYISILLPQVILAETFLSFLGLGIQEPETSLGILISDGANNITFAWWTLAFPTLCLTILLFYFNFISDRFNSALLLKETRNGR
ncbi:MAG: ABC transporter permease subunit [Silvanigrellaceae bacterium]|nr:ABC transporter permease subunit [Silvanigrellaceae bacterium]